MSGRAGGRLRPSASYQRIQEEAELTGNYDAPVGLTTSQRDNAASYHSTKYEKNFFPYGSTNEVYHLAEGTPMYTYAEGWNHKNTNLHNPNQHGEYAVGNINGVDLRQFGGNECSMSQCMIFVGLLKSKTNILSKEDTTSGMALTMSGSKSSNWPSKHFLGHKEKVVSYVPSLAEASSCTQADLKQFHSDPHQITPMLKPLDPSDVKKYMVDLLQQKTGTLSTYNDPNDTVRDGSICQSVKSQKAAAKRSLEKAIMAIGASAMRVLLDRKLISLNIPQSGNDVRRKITSRPTIGPDPPLPALTYVDLTFGQLTTTFSSAEMTRETPLRITILTDHFMPVVRVTNDDTGVPGFPAFTPLVVDPQLGVQNVLEKLNEQKHVLNRIVIGIRESIRYAERVMKKWNQIQFMLLDMPPFFRPGSNPPVPAIFIDYLRDNNLPARFIDGNEARNSRLWYKKVKGFVEQGICVYLSSLIKEAIRMLLKWVEMTAIEPLALFFTSQANYTRSITLSIEMDKVVYTMKNMLWGPGNLLGGLIAVIRSTQVHHAIDIHSIPNMKQAQQILETELISSHTQPLRVRKFSEKWITFGQPWVFTQLAYIAITRESTGVNNFLGTNEPGKIPFNIYSNLRTIGSNLRALTVFNAWRTHGPYWLWVLYYAIRGGGLATKVGNLISAKPGSFRGDFPPDPTTFTHEELPKHDYALVRSDRVLTEMSELTRAAKNVVDQVLRLWNLDITANTTFTPAVTADQLRVLEDPNTLRAPPLAGNDVAVKNMPAVIAFIPILVPNLNNPDPSPQPHAGEIPPYTPSTDPPRYLDTSKSFEVKDLLNRPYEDIKLATTFLNETGIDKLYQSRANEITLCSLVNLTDRSIGSTNAAPNNVIQDVINVLFGSISKSTPTAYMPLFQTPTHKNVVAAHTSMKFGPRGRKSKEDLMAALREAMVNAWPSYEEAFVLYPRTYGERLTVTLLGKANPIQKMNQNEKVIPSWVNSTTLFY